MTAAVLCPSPRSRSYHEAPTKQLASNHDKYATCALNAFMPHDALNSEWHPRGFRCIRKGKIKNSVTTYRGNPAKVGQCRP